MSQENPNFEKRLIIAFVLSVSLMAAVLKWGPKATPAPASPAAKIAIPTSAAQTTPPPTATPTTAASTAAKTPATIEGGKAPAPLSVAASAEQLETLDTPVFHLEISNRGAGVRSWVLKDYKDVYGHPLDAVDADFAQAHGYPLELWPADAELRTQLAQALYTVSRTSGANGAQTLTFEWAGNGIHAIKTLDFDRSYELRVHSTVTRNGVPVAAGVAWPGTFADRASANDFGSEQLVFQTGDKVATVAAKKVAGGTNLEEPYRLAGIEDQYFAAIFLPRDESATMAVTEIKTSYRPLFLAAGGAAPEAVDTLGIAVGTGGVNEARLFVGPKKRSVLEAVDPGLKKLIDFGFFSVIADPLFLWMNWTYQHWIHNYGWVIVFITFVLMTALLPLRIKGQRSQLKMAALQPKVNALNAKAKKYPARDPRRQEAQAEIMKLYSDNGINPVGGCLPMLLQLPLIWAFYQVLRNAIELRDAAWIGYFHDLSSKDPYYVLPLLVVVSQFLTMQYMPATPGQDPRQARMMKFVMPLAMGYIFFFFPSGVNLYYLTSNLISTGQQMWIGKMYGTKPTGTPGGRKRQLAR